MWSKERPTKAGWYWYRGRTTPGTVFVVEVTVGDYRSMACFVSGRREWLAELDGEWQGPITPKE